MKKTFLILLVSFFSLSIVLQAEAAIITDGLVASYSFNGNANDSSGNGNHGIVTGATLTYDRFGNANSAYSFEGNDYIKISDSDSLDMTSAFTISMWVKPSELPAVYYFNLISKGDPPVNSGAPWQLTFSSQGYLDIYRLTNDNYSTVSDVAQLPLNEWSHIAVTFDLAETKVTAYVNSVLAKSWIKNTSMLVDNVPITIGAQIWNGEISDSSWNHFKGQIDDINIFNRALSESEIQQLNAVPIPGAVWLLGSGIIGLISLKRKMREA